jgi:microcystin-dependent protein
MLAWLTKSALPSSLAEYVITLPTDELWQADFFGAIAPLVDAINWEQHEALTPDEMADKWAEVLLPQFWGLKMAVPVGTILMWPTLTPPDSYLVCDGSGYNEADYPALFALIGHTYGNPVSGIFQVPDYRGRVPLGVSVGHALASTGGAETHTLTTGQLPAHNHGTPTGAQAFFIQPTGGAGGSVGFAAGSTMGTNAVTGNAGGGQSHNNLQPFISQVFIIKAE